MKRVLFAAVLLSACAGPKTWAPLDIPKLEIETISSGVRVGIAAVDVTPPPGLRLAGHDGAQTSRGLRTRLSCRAFVFETGAEFWALVPCDLWGISPALSAAVEARLKAAHVPISGERALLFGSRAPSTPAHIYDVAPPDDAKLTKDFDAEVVDWIADRIAAAIIEAYFERTPAVLRWGGRELYGIYENSTPAPAQLPQAVRERLAAKRPLTAKSFERENTPEELLVAGDLAVLRIDRPGDPGRPRPLPMALLAIYPLPVLGGPTDLYDADFAGQLSRELQAQLGARWKEECLILAKSSTHSPEIAQLEEEQKRDLNTTVTAPREILISSRASSCGRDPQIAVGMLSAASADLHLSRTIDRAGAVRDISAAVLEAMDDALDAPPAEKLSREDSTPAKLTIGDRTLAIADGELSTAAALELQEKLGGALVVQSGSVNETSPGAIVVERKYRGLLPLDPEVIHDSFNDRLEVSRTDRKTWELRWWGPEPGFLRSYHRLHVRVLAERRVSKERELLVPVANDYDGAVTIKFLDETKGHTHRWAAEWTPPPDPSCGPHVFEVQGHERLRSMAFNPCEPSQGAKP